MTLKNALPYLPFALAALLAANPSFSQDRIYRCGNEYTNNVSTAKARDCKLVEGGNITVIEGPRGAPAASRVVTAPQAGQRVEANDQRARDNEARSILESELKKAEARRAEIAREYNGGEPERRGDEARNYQKYLDRTAELKASLARVDSDIAGIRRELGRVVPAASK
ncbi:MAG TPA: hypothetical protein VLJ57_25320 [Burkholderiaceae bacterium]|nr:hypothetical protein [Burkholderiaceae bacterium]